MTTPAGTIRPVKSLRAAINAKCRDCAYDPLAGGTWLAQVEACCCQACPLHPHRPRPKPRPTAAAGPPSAGQRAHVSRALLG